MSDMPINKNVVIATNTDDPALLTGSGLVIYRFKFETSVILKLVLLMLFYSVTKVSILPPINVMNRLNLEKRWDLLEIYFQNKDNWSQIARKCRTKFGPGSRRERACTESTSENIEAVAEIGLGNPSTSTRHGSKELNILHISALQSSISSFRFCFTKWANDKVYEKRNLLEGSTFLS